MTDPERLQLMEERYAHLQRHMAEQDKVMLELEERVARLESEVRTLRQQSQSGMGEGGEPESDERPPHY